MEAIGAERAEASTPPLGATVSRSREGKMSYRNKTYVIFDGDNDMWAYAFMKGWKQNDNIDFSLYDAHDIRPLTLTPRE